MGRAARRAREVDRGCGARHGERVSRRWACRCRRRCRCARRRHASRRSQLLLAEYMPFDLVIDEQTAWGEEARVSKTSVCGSWGAIAGELRYFADKFGRPRASIEGTQLPMDLVRRFATGDEAALVYDGERRKAPLVLTRRVEYFGFELEREIEAVDEFPDGPRGRGATGARRALARGEARHFAVKRQPAASSTRCARRGGARVVRCRGSARRSSPRCTSNAARTSTRSRSSRARTSISRRSSRRCRRARSARGTTRCRRARPCATATSRSTTTSRRLTARVIGVARLRLPEKIARTLTEGEVPSLDRPVRFVVTAGQRGLGARARRSTSCRRCSTRRGRRGDRAVQPEARRAARGRSQRHRRGRRAIGSAAAANRSAVCASRPSQPAAGAQRA